MTDLNKFVRDAIRTESLIKTIDTNPVVLEGILQTLIAAGNALDMVKKNVFYGKEIDQQKLEQLSHTAELFASQIRDTRNARKQFSVDPRLFHALVGMTTESIELLEALDAHFKGDELDTVNLLEEMGDINWYEAIALDTLDADFETVLNKVIAKLKARFPDKFTSEDAINRDLDTERKILEQ
jgi:NTP pyrophosphatase (non-canonical NTP hydrolase)